MNSVVLYILGFIILVIWFRSLLKHPFFILITLIVCLGAETIEPIYALDIENKTTLTFLISENRIKKKVHIIDQNKNISEFDTFLFRKLIEQNKTSYLQQKIFPLNERDKCYIDLDIGNVSLPVLANNDTCIHMRSAFLDYAIKWGLILFVLWPICCVIVHIMFAVLLIPVSMCASLLEKRKSSTSE